MDKILIIDGMNFIWRSYTGFRKDTHIYCTDCDDAVKHQLNTPHCTCGADWCLLDNKCKSYNEDYVLIFNFFRNLRPIIELFSPHKCFFVMEGHPQFRYDIYSEYKANRIVKTANQKSYKDKVFKAAESIKHLMQYLPLTLVKANNYEADDVVYSLCENMKEEDLTVVSSDSDYIQLLQKGYKKCKVYNSSKKEFMECPSYHYILWKILSGDKTDNIPSLLKPKKVNDLINNPDLLSKFLELEENRCNFNINKKLIEFAKVPDEELIIAEGTNDFSSLKEEFIKMDFQSIINDKSWIKYQSTFNCIRF